jgi:hypothetical protein
VSVGKMEPTQAAKSLPMKGLDYVNKGLDKVISVHMHVSYGIKCTMVFFVWGTTIGVRGTTIGLCWTTIGVCWTTIGVWRTPIGGI